VERSEEREGGLGGDEVESRVWEISTAPGKEQRTLGVGAWGME